MHQVTRLQTEQKEQARLFMDREVFALPRSPDHWSECARLLICGLNTKPSEAFAENVSARFGLVRLPDRLIPVIVPNVPVPADTRPPQAAVVSPVSHYAHYTEQEMGKRGNPLPRLVRKTLFRIFRFCLGLLQAERVVLVDNWLLTTSPQTRFSAEERTALTALLSDAFPDRALSFRGIVPSLDPATADVFRAPGLVHLRHREVWVSANSAEAFRRKKDLRKDRHLLRTSGYQVLDGDAFLPEYADRACQLYREVYLLKYSDLNLAYTPAFIKLLAQSGFMTFRALRKNGDIDALKSWFVRDGTLYGCLVGHDTTKPQEAGLYRQAIMTQMLEARRHAYPVWMSSGVGRFKSLRGGEPHDEFEAMYTAHLPLLQRLGWQALAWLTRRGGRSA